MRFPLANGTTPCRRGTVAPLTVLNLMLLVGVVAIAVDGGCLLEERRHVQATADAAALAAATDLYTNWNSNQGMDTGGTAKSSALDIASANGYSNDGVTSVVTVNLPGGTYQQGPNAGTTLPAGYTEVIVQSNVGRLFSGVFGCGTIPVQARAAARGRLAPSSNAVILLSLQGGPVVSANGNASLSVASGGVQVNTSSSPPFSGGSNAVTASSFTFNPAIGQGPSSLKAPNGSSPTISYAPPIADPLRYLTAPDPVALGLSVQSTSVSGTSGTVDLYPGIYIGGIISSGNITLHANKDGTPGIYYLEGGGLNLSGGATVLTSSSEAGVMIYNDWLTGSDAISLSGNGSLTLKPPSSGPYQGISIFQKRGTAGSLGPTISMTGGGTLNVTGTIYAAYAGLTAQGSGGSTVLGGQLIVDTITVQGSASIDVNRGSNPISNMRQLGLVE
jgi:hypothetical protein